MIIIRPPQHGHGCERQARWPQHRRSPLAVSPARRAGGARAMLSARCCQQAVVANAVETRQDVD
jgi:hypothetical protein